MKTALILGCSHAAGSEMYKDPQLKNIPKLEYLTYGLTRSYPVKIAKALGYDVIDNQAIPGGSNDAMFRIFEGTNLTSNDIVIACWSGYNRSEFFDSDKWVNIAPGMMQLDSKYQTFFKEWLTFGVDEKVGRLNKIKNIVALNALAQKQGVRVINIDSFWPVSNFEKYGYWPVRENFFSWCEYKKYPKTELGHFFEEAHQVFAEIVIKNINANS